MKIVAKRTHRTGAMWVGIACVILAVGGAAALGATGHFEKWVLWVPGAGVAIYLAAVVWSMVPQKVVLEVSRGMVSTEKVTVRDASVTLGNWSMPGIGAPMGVVAEIVGDGGRLRIGGVGHAGQGLGLGPTSTSSYAIDAQVSAPDFDRMLEALGVSRHVAEDIAIGLVPFSGGVSGALRSIWPWLATMVATGLFGAVCSSLLPFETTNKIVPAGSALIIATGLVFTIARSKKVRGATRVLRLAAGGLALFEPDGREVVRASWSGVVASPQRYFLSGRGGSWWFPVLELSLGSYPPIRVAAWDSTHDWGPSAPRARRLPKWLIGAPQWPLLVSALRANERITVQR